MEKILDEERKRAARMWWRAWRTRRRGRLWRGRWPRHPQTPGSRQRPQHPRRLTVIHSDTSRFDYLGTL
eukprot:3909675-Pleurochrysis_carterae.AAC.1